MPNPEILTETGIDNFKIFIKFLAENDLVEKAAADLKAKGHEKIRVSIEVVKDLQAFIKQEYAAKSNKAADMVTMSAHNNC